MTWLLALLGALMLLVGAYFVLRFWLPRVQGQGEVATARRTWSMLVGALLTTVGTLVLILGVLWSVRGTAVD
jgi:uncharacterized membrane protein YphA (DoxX/SURF4 family)